MEKSLAIKIISIAFFVLFGLSILLGIMFAVNQDSYTDILLQWAYVLSVVAIGGSLLFMILNMFKSKKSIIVSLSILAIFAVILLVSYNLETDVIPSFKGIEEFNMTPGKARWSGTLLYMLYMILGGSFITLIYNEVRGIFK